MTTTLHPKLPGGIERTTYYSVSTSPSKLQYKFGTEDRFPKVNRYGPKEVGYDLPDAKMKRAAGFGIGERFQKKQNLKGKQKTNYSYTLYLVRHPSPSDYNIPSLFSPNNTTSTFAVHCKGKMTYSFGAGRDDFHKTAVNADHIVQNKGYPDKVSPGPKYQILKPLGEEGKKFKLKQKLDFYDVERLERKKNYEVKLHDD